MAEQMGAAIWPGWETVRLIGRGSFGAVYEIQRNIFGDIEKAALKVISIPQNASDIEEMYSDGYDEESITSTFQGHLKSIVGEYSLMRKMNGCTNVVNCDDVRYVQHDDGVGWDIYIKMELLTPLTKMLSANVTEETVIQLAKDMCTALQLCKKYEIVHRDIKPQNIFVSPNGDFKLGDFGIAKTVEKTSGGTKIGTYKYMAPEVYNNKPYGSAADIYSLGLVLYWLLNERRMPFLPLPPAKLGVGMDEAARIRRMSGEQFDEPKNGSKQLKAIVMKACAYRTEDRYSSASEMLQDLNQIGADPSAVVKVPEAPQVLHSVQPDPAVSDEMEDRTVTIHHNYAAADPVVASEVKRPRTPDESKNGSPVPRNEPELQQDEQTVMLYARPEAKKAADNQSAPQPAEPVKRAEPVIQSGASAASAAQAVSRQAAEPPVEPALNRRTGNKKLPFLIGAAVAAVAAIICVVLLVFGNSGDKDPQISTQPFPAATQATTPQETITPSIPVATEPSVKNITLTVWTPALDQSSDTGWLQTQLRAFEKAHPEYAITWNLAECDANEVSQRVTANVSAAADVYLYPNDQIPLLVEAGALAPISGEYLKQIQADNPQTMVNCVTHTDGCVYGFPYTSNTWFMYYDKSVFSQEDIQSLDTMLKKGKVAFPLSEPWYLFSFYAANGATLFGDRGNDASAGIVLGRGGDDVTMYLADLVKNPNFKIDSNGLGIKGIADGTIHAIFSGNWVATEIQAHLGDNMGVAQLPSITINGEPKQLKAFAGASAIGVNARSANPEAAMQLAAFLASVDSQRKHFEMNGVIPSASVLASDPALAGSPVAVAQNLTAQNASVMQPMLMEMGYYWGPSSQMCQDLCSRKITSANAFEKTYRWNLDINNNRLFLSGMCGDSINWSLDAQTGAMKIWGSGEMPVYENPADVPWYHLNMYIQRVEISEGITTVCNYAFDECSNLKEVIIADSVKKIGVSAFNWCAMTEITLPDGIEEIDETAFWSCNNLQSVVLPAGLKKLGKYAFGNCSKLNSVVFQGDAPEIGDGAFRSVFASVSYPKDNSTWNQNNMQDYGGKLTWRN